MRYYINMFSINPLLFIMYRVMYIEYDVSLLVVYVVCIIEAAV